MMKIHANSTLLMIGDSITDCGRARPIAEGINWDLGNGYVSLIHAFLGANCPEKKSASATRGSLETLCGTSRRAGKPMFSTYVPTGSPS